MYIPEEILGRLQAFGINALTHSGSSLKSHLTGTHAILEKWRQAPYICLAGLCHSVYGTESYSPQTVPLEMRSSLVDIIGEKAESLAYLFGAHEKESLWKNLKRSKNFKIKDRFAGKEVSISREDLSDLVTLTLANWLEQRPRADEKYKFLRKKEFYASKILLPKPAWEEFKKAYEIL